MAGHGAGPARASLAERLFDLGDHPLRARESEVLEREPELAAHAVEKAEIEVAPGVIRLKLDRAAKLLFGFAEHSRLELDQAEVRVKDGRARVVSEQRPRGAPAASW